MKREEELKKLNQEIESCKKCLLWKGAKNVVPGEGMADAKIMFIGESPGREEDISGRPFVGRAGRFLNELLKENKIDRRKVFITSTIKHRPPNNRQPKREELEACKIWLKKQIEIIKPKLIILLGRVASDTVLGKDYWQKRGKFFQKDEQYCFITYHPAASLRFPKIRKILEKDFKKLKKFINS